MVNCQLVRPICSILEAWILLNWGMRQRIKLTGDSIYHIYNRGNNKEMIFKGHGDYLCFLKLIQKYIIPVAEIFAYNLLGNHFHLVVKIKPYDPQSSLRRPLNAGQAFSNLFNAYAKSFNLKYGRTGKLFAENFKRKEVTDDFYLTRLIYYIHSNAQKHRFAKDFRKYPYSSYFQIVSSKETIVSSRKVLDWFGGKEMFEKYHAMEQQLLHTQTSDSIYTLNSKFDP